jgi:hypothetical protein
MKKSKSESSPVREFRVRVTPEQYRQFTRELKKRKLTSVGMLSFLMKRYFHRDGTG